VDICNRLPIFAEFAANCPNAESTERTLQLPVYEGLTEKDIERIIRVVREASTDLPSLHLEGAITV
jgi:dTDP-4-amino-4,6-dideoxygalactose transaminase